MDEVSIDHDADRRRYAIRLDGEVIGGADYRDSPEGRIFTHTVIAPELTRRGYGTRLVEAAVDDTRSAGLTPIGQCSMVRAYLAKHPDLAVAP